MSVMQRAVSDAQRIASLRQRCLDRKARIDFDRNVAVHRAMQQSADMPWQRRIGLRTRYLLEHTRLAVDDLELLMGRLDPQPLGPLSDEQREAAQAFKDTLPPTGGQTGHCQLHYDDVLALGIDGIVRQIENRMTDADDRGGIVLQSLLDALAGLSTFIDHAADTAEAGPDRTDVTD